MTAAFAFMTIGWALCLLVKARALKRDPNNPYLRWICVTLGLAVVATASSVPSVLTFLEGRTGVLAVWVIAPGAAGAIAVRVTLLLCFYSPSEARRKIRSGLILLGIATAAVIILCLAGHQKAGDISGVQTPMSPRWGTEAVSVYGPWAATPYVREAYLVFCATFSYGYASSAGILLAAAKLVDRRWILRTVWGFVFVCLMMVTHVLACAGFFVLYRFGVWLPELLGGAMIALGLAAIGTTVSYSLPLLGSRWNRMVVYRQLGPLWSALRRSFPEVVLENPRAALFDAWNPWRSDFRLCRRVIEIRDGILALRHHLSPEVAVIARRLGHAAKQNESDLEASILAAQLTCAIRDRRYGRPPSAEAATEVFAPPRGDSLDAELALLLPLAHAFARSEIVKKVAAHATEFKGRTTDFGSGGLP